MKKMAMRILKVLLICFAMTGCATVPDRFRGAESPLAYDPSALDAAHTIVVMVPGALASTDIFAPAEAWGKEPGVGLVRYRLPGLDGLPLDHRLGIADAARQITGLLEAHPGRKIRLLGYSTGGPVVILAGASLDGDVRIAAMSSAVERGGGLATRSRGAADILAAALRARSLDRREVWFEYYRTLLFGRAGLRAPDLQNDIDRIVAAERQNIVVPDADLSAAHTGDLSRWHLPGRLSLAPSQLRFFVGTEDPVFSEAQTSRFAERLGGAKIVRYPRDGHLLFVTRPEVFEDIAAFFEL